MVIKIEESEGGAYISEILFGARRELYGIERENAEVVLAIFLALLHSTKSDDAVIVRQRETRGEVAPFTRH